MNALNVLFPPILTTIAPALAVAPARGQSVSYCSKLYKYSLYFISPLAGVDLS